MSFPTLREKLSKPPSRRLFAHICKLFDAWEGDDIHLAIEYASEHLETWKDELRYAKNIKNTAWSEELPVWWSLVRSYEHNRKSIPDTWSNCPQALQSIHQLTMPVCNDVKDIDFIKSFANLTHLHMHSCWKLQDIRALSHLNQLIDVALFGCGNLRNIDALAELTNLKRLTLDGCSNLQELNACSHLSKLVELTLSAPSIQRMDALAGLTNLTHLDFYSPELENIDVLAKLTRLTHLVLDCCRKVASLRPLEALENLKHLSLSDQIEEKELPCFRNYAKLESLVLSGWNNLEDIDSITALSTCTHLNLSFCEELENIDALANLTNLVYLNLYGCSSLELQPEIKQMHGRENISPFQEKLRKHIKEKSA